MWLVTSPDFSILRLRLLLSYWLCPGPYYYLHQTGRIGGRNEAPNCKTECHFCSQLFGETQPCGHTESRKAKKCGPRLVRRLSAKTTVGKKEWKCWCLPILAPFAIVMKIMTYMIFVVFLNMMPQKSAQESHSASYAMLYLWES